MNQNEKIVNYVSSNHVCSNLVYPLGKGYYYVAKLDKEWVNDRLRNSANIVTNSNEGLRISNKYCIKLNVNGFIILVTNHDDTYWLTMKEDS